MMRGDAIPSRSRSRISGGTLTPLETRQETSTTAGMLAARAWLSAQGLWSPGASRWSVEILLDIVDQPARAAFDQHRDTRLRIEVCSQSWGLWFCHRGRVSAIRVDEVVVAEGPDELGLLASTPALKDLGVLVRQIETEHAIHFWRRKALVMTDLPSAEPAIRRWVETL